MRLTPLRILAPLLIIGLMAAACGNAADRAATTNPTEAPTTVATTQPSPGTTTTDTPGPSTSTSTTLPYPTYAVPVADHCVIDTASSDRLNVRLGPGTEYPIVGSIAHDATGVTAVGLASDDPDGRMWLLIGFETERAWVASWFLTPGPCTVDAPGAACVTDTLCTDRLNVRAGPSGLFPVVGSLSHDAVGIVTTGATSLDEQGRVWAQIEYHGEMRWVASWFLTDEPCTASAGLPCSCPDDAGRGREGFVHRVEPLSRIIWIDFIESYYSEEGWADSEAIPVNDDPTVWRLAVDDSAVVTACEPLESGGSCTLEEGAPWVAEYDLATFASWIAADRILWQSDLWATYSTAPYSDPVAGANNQWWSIHLEGCSVVGIDALYHP